ncbi:MAG TPA: glycosyltransferase family 1 protein [Candidatus Desulfofervidus auxilii]|uniref:Glycosyltransferase family 1 protein n=1 Tax=Desulfofervidus auxilii TaxID=1621989 RepID=A0A7C0Y6W9_DESA2|nr:glycosyltransferase family 1 protein [Candidatus Desulfofervidus auxilii]
MFQKIAIVAAIYYEPYAPDHKGLKQGLEWLNCKYIVCDPITESPSKILRKIKDFHPDLVLHHMSRCLILGLPEMIGKDIPQVFWMLDYRPQDYFLTKLKWELDIYKYQAQFLKYWFISNKCQISFWKEQLKIPVDFLPHACYIVNKLEYDKRFHYPCVFMGGMYNDEIFKPRKEFIQKIANMTNIKLILNCSGEERQENWFNMPKIYYSSDAVLDISHFWNCKGYASGRFFYTSGYGAAAVSKWFPDCEELYPSGTKLYFNTTEEAVDLIHWLQKNSKEREKIKQKAFNYGKKHHNYAIRWKKIFETLKQ